MFENPELEKQIEEDKKQEEVIRKLETPIIATNNKRKRKARGNLKFGRSLLTFFLDLELLFLVQNVCLRLLNSWHLKLE